MFEFDWDPSKAASNLRKHGIDFRMSATVILDPLSKSELDERYRDAEERWITVGKDENGQLQVVCHTYRDKGNHTFVRIISARSATRNERRKYESEQ